MRLHIALMPAVFSLITTSLVSTGWSQVSAVDANRLGMEIAWQAQVQMPRVGRGIVSSHLWVEPTLVRKFAVVELDDGRTIRVSADQLTSRGVPLGIEEAKKQAGERAAKLLGKNDGFEVVETTIPQIRLVFVTNDGLVQTFDAETGALLWSTPCGSATAPAHPAAVSPAGVTVIHGRNLYLLDWQTGKQLLNVELKFGSSVALAVCNTLAYITDFRGRLEAYGLGVTFKPWSSQIIGRAVGQPVTLPDQSYCALASTDGYVYTLTGGETPGLWTRYETSSDISGSLAAGNGAFYAGTGDGLLTKISMADRLGHLAWEYPAGVTITTPALITGKHVVAATEAGALHCIDDATGYRKWATEGLRIQQPFAAAGGNILCTTFSNEIYAIDVETGTPVARTLPSNIVTAVINQVSDRAYVVGLNGRVQCLRTQGAVLPKVTAPAVLEEEAPAEENAAAAAATPATAADAADNPFNFGGAAAPATPSGTSPFGGADNPFGSDPAPPADSGMGTPPSGAAAGETSNPFGSMPDPFGTTNPF
jgi:outer membrane protein assembly factor BamB